MTREYPEVGELVVCTVKNVKNYGAFVLLDEYDGKEGFIHIAEIATGWVKYIRDHIKEGQKVVCKVLNIDESKGHIDLSLKRVNEHQRREKIQQWKDDQRAKKLFEVFCGRAGMDVDDAYREFGQELIDEYGSMYLAFENAVMDRDNFIRRWDNAEWTDDFVKMAEENIVPPYVRISGYVKLFSLKPKGMNTIKAALSSIEADDVKVQYVGAPWYRIIVEADDYKHAEENLRSIAEKVISKVKKDSGYAEFHRRLSNK